MGTSRLALVGAFVAAGILVFGVGLFLIGDRRLMFVDRYELFTEFSKVTGVQVGTAVRVAGLPAGEVTDILIPSGPAGRFRVKMRIRADLRALVRKDSVATIQSDGIVGNAFVQIGGGTDAAAVAPPDSTITGRDPIELADLIEEGRDTFRTVTREILELRAELSVAVGALTGILKEANTLIVDLGGEARLIAAQARRATGDVSAAATDVRAIMADVKAGKGNLGRLVKEDTLYVSATTMAKDAQATLANVKATTARLREAVDSLQAEGGPTDKLVADLSSAVSNAREVMSDLAENTEAVKRHWLTRGFFKDRGYFDLDSMTVDEYRKGAVDGGRRAPLRLWLDAANLFEPSKTGQTALTDAGRRRLDLAMADLLEYPRDSPIVVEGYAVDGTVADRYLLSHARARLAQDYIQRRYRRDSSLVGNIAIGLDAQGSPRGNERWDGIAVVVYVRKDLLARAARGSATVSSQATGKNGVSQKP
jgi:phospholipid/cholesterol/gamma-HCH transport system substrate-binding protein